MTYHVLVPVVGSLIGTLIGAGAALMGQRRQWRRDRRASNQDACKLAVEELAVRAMALDVASHQAVAIAASSSSLGGQLNRLLGMVSPLDPQALFAGMNTHFEGLNRAAAQLRLTGDQHMVTLTNALTFAAASVIEAHHSTPSGWSPVRVLRGLLSGMDIGDAAAINKARNEMGEALRELTERARKHLDLPRVGNARK